MAADKVDVTIRIDKAEAGRMDEIVQALKARGLDRVESHARFMIVNGSIAPDAFDALRGVKGVVSVRQDRSYKTQDL
jgi:methylmalonyl-CoA mutase cobalamin-binding subunit